MEVSDRFSSPYEELVYIFRIVRHKVVSNEIRQLQSFRPLTRNQYIYCVMRAKGYLPKFLSFRPLTRNQYIYYLQAKLLQCLLQRFSSPYEELVYILNHMVINNYISRLFSSPYEELVYILCVNNKNRDMPNTANFRPLTRNQYIYYEKSSP